MEFLRLKLHIPAPCCANLMCGQGLLANKCAKCLSVWYVSNNQSHVAQTSAGSAVCFDLRPGACVCQRSNVQTLTHSETERCWNVLWAHMFSETQLLAALVQRWPLMWSNPITALATLTLATAQSAVAVALWLPACLGARDNLGRQTRGDSNSHFSSAALFCPPPSLYSVSICESLPVSGLDEVLLGSGASVRLH